MEKNMPEICTVRYLPKLLLVCCLACICRKRGTFAYLTPLSERQFTERLQNELIGFRVLTSLENGEITGNLFYHPHEAGAASMMQFGMISEKSIRRIEKHN